MVTINKRTGLPQAVVINGLDAGGVMTAKISAGYDTITHSAPDGLQVPLKDREAQYVRGSIETQDWSHAIALLMSTVGTLVFYERKSGVDEATGYTKHTITAPVIHSFRLTVTKGNYAKVNFNFECRAADPTKTISDMWTMTDSSPAPTYVTAARGGVRIEAALHGTLAINHVTAFSFGITMQLVKACNDGDIGYTCVDARVEGLAADGSITFQDSTITTGSLLCQQLILAVRANLVLTIRQAQGATDKVLTIAGVEFNTADSDSGAEKDFTEYTANFDVANDATTQLTLAGTNKIIAIA